MRLRRLQHRLTPHWLRGLQDDIAGPPDRHRLGTHHAYPAATTQPITRSRGEATDTRSIATPNEWGHNGTLP